MGTVYKFASGEAALDRLLFARTIRFTPPDELNDPYECGVNTEGLDRAVLATSLLRYADSVGLGGFDEDDVR
ncbi:MAG: hypothetical protein EON58_19775, partial [Alphaproteobacteria bacterium]